MGYVQLVVDYSLKTDAISNNLTLEVSFVINIFRFRCFEYH